MKTEKFIVTIQQKVEVEIDLNSSGSSSREITRKIVKDNKPYSGVFGGGYGIGKKKFGYVGYNLETRDKIKIISIVKRKK